MTTKLDAEKKLRAAVDANPEYKAQWGDAWDKIAAAEKTYAEFYARYRTLSVQGDLFSRARHLVRLAEEKSKPSPERLREYRDSNMDSIELELYSPAPIYDELEIDRVASSLQLMGEILGAKDPTVVKILGGLPPRERAVELVHGTALKDVGARKKLAEGGAKAIAESTATR
jgi:hypothetical protein